ncbi:CoA-transferase [Anaerotruncus rubiinfantis]|uniref:CoA-transferase n=1 Tax=Anaerotruncus rubiinfantis TaxID=1720200 RepID=UPI001897B741|nr:CoA-transferase [Anaerotruncus rubiinfantis]
MDYRNLGAAAFYDADGIAAQIHDGDTVALGGLWFIRLPLALIGALVRRGVKDLTIITQASGYALEQLICAGLVKKVIYSFISLDLLGLAPAFRSACQNGEIEYEEWTALQMNTALEAARLGLPYGVLQPPEGSSFDRETGSYRHADCPFTGRKIGLVRALCPDVALIHAQQADREGNVAVFGTMGLDKLYIGASKKAFVSVEELVEPHNFLQDSRAHIFPHFLISGLCVHSGGAYPASCLPYYATDYERLLEALPGEPFQNPSKARLARLREYAGMTNNRLRKAIAPCARTPDPEGYTPDELMACLMSRQIQDHMVTTVGSNTPLAMVAYLLAKGTRAPHCTLIPFCGLVDLPYGPASLSFAEPVAYHAAAAHWAIEDLWQWIYQKSLTAVEFGGCAQLDANGNINNSQIRGAQGELKVLLPGQAGLADILNLHHNAYYYITKHEPRRIGEAVSYPGGRFCYVTAEEREKQGLPDGCMRVITDLCVLELEQQSRRLWVTQIHPGVTREQIRRNTGFDVMFSPDVQETRPPTADELYKIRHEIDPFGYRRLEFTGGEERMNLIREILEKEAELRAVKDKG